jgi:two-component system KDP operon response regulator KdpE
MEFRNRVVRTPEKTAKLSRTEFAILVELVKSGGAAVAAEGLTRAIWGAEAAVDRQTLRVHVGNLRKKLEQNPSDPLYVRTVTGFGYRVASLDSHVREFP